MQETKRNASRASVPREQSSTVGGRRRQSAHLYTDNKARGPDCLTDGEVGFILGHKNPLARAISNMAGSDRCNVNLREHSYLYSN